MTPAQWASGGIIQSVIKGAAGLGIKVHLVKPGELGLKEFQADALKELNNCKELTVHHALQRKLLDELEQVAKSIAECKP